VSIAPETHRALAVELFNRSWELLRASRTAGEDELLIHVVHASRYHWGEIGNDANLARGESQCARAYAAVGRPEPALHHAVRCLDLVERGGKGFEEWDLASAYEIVARAHLVAGERGEAERFARLARDALRAVEDAEDREIIELQLAELGLPGQA
jgi:hypothetical protein